MNLATRIARTLALLLLLLGAHVASPAAAQTTQPPSGPTTTAAQDEYVPIDQLPQDDKLPAAPFLIAAYAVAWGAVLIYVLMLWRRLGRVEVELREARRAVGGR